MIMPARRSSKISAIFLLLATSPMSAQEIVAETPKVQTAIDRTPIVEAPITESDRAHWAFQPIKRQSLPSIKETAWPRTPIDALISARLEAKHISPSAEASRSTLLRRLSFDLIGLPP